MRTDDQRVRQALQKQINELEQRLTKLLDGEPTSVLEQIQHRTQYQDVTAECEVSESGLVLKHTHDIFGAVSSAFVNKGDYRLRKVDHNSWGWAFLVEKLT